MPHTSGLGWEADELLGLPEIQVHCREWFGNISLQTAGLDEEARELGEKAATPGEHQMLNAESSPQGTCKHVRLQTVGCTAPGNAV